MVESRPWGTYEILYEDEYCKVKKIVVNPGQRLSYQFHEKRDESWTIIQGLAVITINEETKTRYPGQSISIPRLYRHRVAPLKETLIFIEVQTGQSFDEDDIIRIEDDYKRV